MGHHQLSRGECHHPSDVGLAFGEARKAELFSDLDRGLHARFSPLRNGDEPRNADRGPRAARPGRRRVATVEPGRAARCVSAREARLGDDFVRHRRAACTGGRADARRLHHRQLWLALDLFHQYPHRPPRPVVLQHGRARPRLLKGPAICDAQEGRALRYNRSLSAEPHDDLLGDRAKQRTGMGLARRSVLPRAYAAGHVRARSRHAHLARTANPESAYQFSNAGRPKLSLVVHHYFLRVWRALRQHHHAARLAAIALWLRCHDFGTGALARGPICRDDALGRRSS